ncbi:MAG: 50S ribosomal protein L3 [Proteobacteria bacterium]|nr:50S ribosomal protein L3 [Pseudomonadota bacterium]
MQPLRGAVAKKVGMSRVMDDYGRMVAVTLLKLEDQKITKILSPERDGYSGYQVGYFVKSEKNLNKPDVVRLRKAGILESYGRFREFRCREVSTAKNIDTAVLEEKGYVVGKDLRARDFSEVKYVDVSGLTKGRGFQGATKRWGFRISSMTHGSRYHRRTGSIGNCATPARVMPGKKMPGRYGQERRTLRKLAVVVRDEGDNLLAIKGAVPGCRGSYVEVCPSVCCL